MPVFERQLRVLTVLLLLVPGLFGCARVVPEQPVVSFPATGTATASEPGGVETSAPAGQPVLATATDISCESHLLVVYAKGGNLWKSEAGDILQISDSGQDERPKLSSDGKLVIFQRGTELWVMDVLSKDARKLYGMDGVVPSQFEFAVKTQQVYFTTSAANGSARLDLNMVDANGGGAVVLLPTGQAGKFTFTPDGQILALVQADKIITVRPDGSGRNVVYQFAPIKGVNGEYLPPVAWLETGYGFKTVIPGRNGGKWRFMFVPVAGGLSAQLAEFPAVSPAFSDVFIAPDGSKLLYLREKGDNFELHVIDASTADRTYFTYAGEKIGIMGWMPDSIGILFWLEDPRGAWFADGKTQAPLGDGIYASDIIWLNSTWFIFVNGSELRVRSIGQPSQILDTGIDGSYAAVIVQKEINSALDSPAAGGCIVEP